MPARRMTRAVWFVVLTLLLSLVLNAHFAHSATAAGTTPAYPQCPVTGGATGCNELISIGPVWGVPEGGTSLFTVPDQGVAIGIDLSQPAINVSGDIRVGVVNNTSEPVGAVTFANDLGSHAYLFHGHTQEECRTWCDEGDVVTGPDVADDHSTDELPAAYNVGDQFGVPFDRQLMPGQSTYFTFGKVLTPGWTRADLAGIRSDNTPGYTLAWSPEIHEGQPGGREHSPDSPVEPEEQGAGPNPREPDTACSAGDPVNCASGALSESSTDLSIAVRGPALRDDRAYDTQRAGHEGMFGYGWTSDYEMYLTAADNHITLHQENGSTIPFDLLPDGDWAGPPRVMSALTEKSDGTYRLSDFGGRRVYAFDATGALTAETDLDGDRLSLDRDAAGRLSKVSSGARSISFDYNGAGLVSTVQDTAGRSVSYNYDAAGDLVKVTDATGAVWNYGYDSSHLLTSVTRPSGGITTNTFDTAGRLLSQRPPNGDDLTLSYTGDPSTDAGGTTTITDARGATTVDVFSDFRLLTRTISSPDTAPATTSFTYDGAGDVITVSDPEDRKTTNTYDAQGDLTSTTNGAGDVTHLTYNEYDEPALISRAAGSTTFGYDSLGNLTAMTREGDDATPATTTYGHDDPTHPGDVTDVTGPTGATWHNQFDGEGDLMQTTDPLGRTTTFTYDDAGHRVAMTRPKGVANHAINDTDTTTYDALGRVTSSGTPDGTTRYGYDGDGNLVSERNAVGQTTRYVFDGADELTEVVNPSGATRRYGYDSTGDQVSQTDAAGRRTKLDYNALGQLTGIAAPGGSATSITPGADGETVSVTKPSGTVINYGYDKAGRIKTVSYPGHADLNVTYTRDADGNVTSVGEPAAALLDSTSLTASTSSTSTFTYDGLDRLTGESSLAGTVTYAYNPAGQVATLEVNPAVPGIKTTVTRTYDDAGELTKVTTDNTSSASSNFTYDLDGNQTGEALANGDVTIKKYDSSGDLASTQTTSPKGLVVFDESYTDNPASHLASRTDAVSAASVSRTYDYNPDGQLAKVSVPTPATVGNPVDALPPAEQAIYDPSGAITSLTTAGVTTSFSYDGAGDLIGTKSPALATALSNDTDGNRLDQTITGPATTPAKTSYSWNAADELTRVSTASSAAGSSSAPLTERFAYRADGLRADLLYDRVDGVVPLIVGDQAHVFAYGPNNEPLTQITAGAVPMYLTTDRSQSVRLVTDGQGNPLGRFDYTAFGKTISGAVSLTPLMFQGQYRDPIGLYYMRARWYDPATGQFLSRDPYVLQTGQPYAFADDDPINKQDPSGAAVRLNCMATSEDWVLWHTEQVSCIANDSEGNEARVTTSVHGFSLGIGAGVYSALAISDAPTVFDLQGSSIESSSGFAVGPIGATAGSSSDQANAGGGAAFGFDVSVAFHDWAHTNVEWLGCGPKFEP